MKISMRPGQILYGSTLAGIGLSFGRDIYRTGKKNVGALLILAAIASVALFSYLAGRWAGRNYRTFDEKILYSIPAIIISVFAAGFFLDATAGNSQDKDFDFFVTGFLMLPMIIGIVSGRYQCSDREKFWIVEDYNNSFLVKHGLEEFSKDQLRDEDGQIFKFNRNKTSSLEFAVGGEEKKRAFLRFNPKGEFTEWSEPRQEHPKPHTDRSELNVKREVTTHNHPDGQSTLNTPDGANKEQSMMIIFPYANKFSVPLDAFLEAWTVMFKTHAPNADPATSLMPILALKENLATCENKHPFSLDVMCRKLVPSGYRNTAQAMPKFIRLNSQTIKRGPKIANPNSIGGVRKAKEVLAVKLTARAAAKLES